MSTLSATLENTRQVTTEIRRQRGALKKALPQVSIYKNNPDGSPGLVYCGRINVRDMTKYSFPQRKNVSSSGQFECRASHYLAKFIANTANNPDEKKNIVVRVDMYGGRWRWTGLLHHWDIETRDGIDYFTASFNDDMQYLQFILAPPNSALPIPVFQFPRVGTLFGPSVWAVSTLLLLQAIRLNGHIYTLPDDPFDLGSWTDTFEPQDWQWHVKAKPFLSDGSLWTLLASRMNTVDNVIADALEDGQLAITYRRYFTGEGETVTGLLNNNIANGSLVFEVTDRSGFTFPGGTFFNGNAASGLTRSVLTWADGYIEDVLTAVTDSETLYPDEYWQSSWMSTLAAAPGLCLRDSSYHDLQSKVTHSPATAVSVIVGGDNPTADAIAKLIIESVGNLLGYFLLAGFDSAGTIAADVIMPFLVGTIAAWDEWKNTGRVTNVGWVHLNEIFQQGGEANAWSLSALAALRGGFKASQAQTSHTMVIGANSWAIPGLHFNVGDRMASTSGALQRRMGIDVMFVNQVEEMSLQGDAAGAFQFVTKVGQNKAAMSQGERTARLFKKILDTLSNIGVHLIS